MDRSWMYERLLPNRRGLNPDFKNGVTEFVTKAKERSDFKSEGGIRCPCVKCKCEKILSPTKVKEHLHRVGFQPNYWIWTLHGEVEPEDDDDDQVEVDDEDDQNYDDNDQDDDDNDPDDSDHEHMDEDDEQVEVMIDKPVQYDVDGKVILRPYGKLWVPVREGVNALNKAIKTQFPKPFDCWGKVDEETKQYWFSIFKDEVTWESCHNKDMWNAFNHKGCKSLSDLLGRARRKFYKDGTRPSWIAESVWNDLITYWQSPEFQGVSSRNKVNRASNRGGSLHTSGRISHMEVAFKKAQELGRSIDPDELFLATHTRKSGDWVDARSATTYTKYKEKLKEVQCQLDYTEDAHVDGSTKLGLWKEVVGGKRRGRCYGTADLSSQIQPGVTSLIQKSPGPSDSYDIHYKARIEEVIREAAEAKAAALRTEETLQKVLSQMKEMQAQLLAGATTSASQNPGRAVYLDYNKDLDAQSKNEADLPKDRAKSKQRRRR